MNTTESAAESEPLIPVAEISEVNFWAALKPLYDLIGSTPMHQYAGDGGPDGGMVLAIQRDEGDMRMHVRFKHAVSDRNAESPWPVVEVGEHEEFAELAYDVDIVVKPVHHADPIHELWPDGFPAAETTNNEVSR